MPVPYEQEPVFGEIYNVDDTFIYHCEYCATSFYDSEFIVTIRADEHRRLCNVKPYKYK